MRKDVTKKSLKNRFFGFTIIELLLYMGLLAIFLSVISEIFIASLDVQTESESISSLEQDGRYIMSRFRYDLTRASSISLPANSGDSGSILQMTINGQTVSYTLSGTNFLITEGGTPNQLNSSESLASGLQFTRSGNATGKPLITTSITLTSSTKREKGAEVKTYQTTQGMR